METAPLKTRAAIAGYAIVGFGTLLKVLDIVDQSKTALEIAQAAPSLIISPWFPIVLILIGFGFIAWSFISEQRRKKGLPFALVHVETEERSIARDDIGYTIRRVGNRAVIVWFENQSKYKLQKVRALLYFVIERDRRIEYHGLWLDESWRDVQFDPHERKGLVLIVEQGGKYVAPSERRENEQHQLMPEFHPVNEECCTMHLTLTVEGIPCKQPDFQVEIQPHLEVLTFWH